MGVAVGVLVLLGYAFMGNSNVLLALRPLTHLGVPFPAALRYAPVAGIAAAGALWWLGGRRRRPGIGFLLGVAAELAIIYGVVHHADGRLAKIPTTRSLTREEVRAVSDRAAVPIWQQAASGVGHEVFVEDRPGLRDRVAGELDRAGVLRRPGDPLW